MNANDFDARSRRNRQAYWRRGTAQEHRLVSITPQCASFSCPEWLYQTPSIGLLNPPKFQTAAKAQVVKRKKGRSLVNPRVKKWVFLLCSSDESYSKFVVWEIWIIFINKLILLLLFYFEIQSSTGRPRIRRWWRRITEHYLVVGFNGQILSLWKF